MPETPAHPWTEGPYWVEEQSPTQIYTIMITRGIVAFVARERDCPILAAAPALVEVLEGLLREIPDCACKPEYAQRAVLDPQCTYHEIGWDVIENAVPTPAGERAP